MRPSELETLGGYVDKIEKILGELSEAIGDHDRYCALRQNYQNLVDEMYGAVRYWVREGRKEMQP